MLRNLRTTTGFLLAGLVSQFGCGTSDADSASDDLTSISAEERALSFDGYVDVPADITDDELMRKIALQAKTAFGALRMSDLTAANRELRPIDHTTLVREPLTLINEDGTETPVLRVRYHYTDQAIVPKGWPHSSIQLGLIHGDPIAHRQKILVECTQQSEEDIAFSASAMWYVFNPALDTCRKAINDEQDAIDVARQALTEPTTQVVPSEYNRLYMPMTAKLEPVATQQGATYPEYDRLYRGGIEKNKVNITVYGGTMEDHTGLPENIINDEGFWESLLLIETLVNGREGLELVKTTPEVDLFNYTIGEHTFEATLQDLVNWNFYEEGYPEELTTPEDILALRVEVARRLYRTELRFEDQVKVKIGTAAAEKVTIVIKVFFGVAQKTTEFLQGIQSSDVFIYNGHTYIGRGALDPTNFAETDFPRSYQILFMDACVSFNYYNKDYFGLKPDGTKSLDTIVNGLESNSEGSGAAEGKFILKLLNGKQVSYKELLRTASTPGGYTYGVDPLRVVDGEIDNVYKPTKTPIVVTE